MAFKINHLHFKSPDPKTTAQWYVDHLGAKIEGELGTIGYRLDLNGITINVSEFVEGQKLEQFYGLEHVALDTDDMDATIADLEAAGSSILEQREPGGGWKICFFEGPQGVRLEVIQNPQ